MEEKKQSTANECLSGVVDFILIKLRKIYGAR